MSELELQVKSDSEDTKETDPDTPSLISSLGNIIPPTTSDGAGDDLVVGQPINAADSLLRTLTLNANNTLVNQFSRQVFHFPGDEALRAIVETFLLRVTWVQVFARHNFTTTDISQTVRVLSRRTVASGTETNRELNIGLAYRGLSIGYGTSTKTFSSNETVSEHETTTVYTIPPQRSLYVYQRRYYFRDDIWWIADAWRDYWNVCTPGGGFNLLRVSNQSHIDAEEHIAIDVPLTGTQSVNVARHNPVDFSFRQINRQFQNHTTRTRNAVTRVINDSARRSTVHRTAEDIEADIEA